MVEFAQILTHKNMAYSYENSFDMPNAAFEKGKGYCWQQAKALQKILRALGFECYLVYAVKNQMPEKEFEGVKINAHISGHVWCRVKIDEMERDVCPGNIKNKPGKVHFTPLSAVKKWNPLVAFGSYWGSAYVNYKRIREIHKT